MSFKFDIHLIPNCLADQGFQSTGIYNGVDAGVYYAVIDPRRHNINVWDGGAPNPHHSQGYRLAAIRHGTNFATNGPMMAPPAGSSKVSLYFWVAVLFIISLFAWRPFDRVIKSSRVAHRGKGIVKSYFARSGQGSFSAYSIGNGSAPISSLEGLSGLVRLVANGGIVNDADTAGIQAAVGIASWGLRPIPPTPTDGWTTEVPYIDDGEEDLINGVIVAAASSQGVANIWMAIGMLAVGCTEAVAMDGSDSVVCVQNGALTISCTGLKDEIQQWGLYCQ